jgi:hypothetical protein
MAVVLTITYTNTSPDYDLPIPDPSDQYFAVNNTVPPTANGKGFGAVNGQFINAGLLTNAWNTDTYAFGFQGALVNTNGSEVSVGLETPASAANMYFCTTQTSVAALNLLIESTCQPSTTVYQYVADLGQLPKVFNPNSIGQFIGQDWKVIRSDTSSPVLLIPASEDVTTLPPLISVSISSGTFTSLGFLENPTLGLQLLQWATETTPSPGCAPSPPPPRPGPGPNPAPGPSPTPDVPNVTPGINGVKLLQSLEASYSITSDVSFPNLSITFDTTNNAEINVTLTDSVIVTNVQVNEVCQWVRLACKVYNSFTDPYLFQTNYFFARINGSVLVPLYSTATRQEYGYLCVQYKVKSELERVITVQRSSENLIPPEPASTPTATPVVPPGPGPFVPPGPSTRFFY